FRPSRLSGGRYLRDLPASDGRWGDDQPSTARRANGLRPNARRHLDRVASEGSGPRTRGAPVVHAERRPMVGWPDRRFLDLTGCEQPIIQAPMAGAGGVELCIAAVE